MEVKDKSQLIKFVDSLNQNDKMVLCLDYFEALTFKEIADVLKMSEETVRRISHRITDLWDNSLGGGWD